MSKPKFFLFFSTLILQTIENFLRRKLNNNNTKREKMDKASVVARMNSKRVSKRGIYAPPKCSLEYSTQGVY
jgi:hypothetical protein